MENPLKTLHDTTKNAKKWTALIGIMVLVLTSGCGQAGNASGPGQASPGIFNSAPQVVVTTPGGPQSGDVTIAFTARDNESNDISISRKVDKEKSRKWRKHFIKKEAGKK